MKIIHKGNYGYIEFQKKWTILRTIIYFALCLAIFVIGYITTGTRRNLLTIVAVLGFLPASKSAVNVIMFLKAKGCSLKDHELIEKSIHSLSGLYDLYMTTYKKDYAISHIVVAEKTIVGYTTANASETGAIEKHIQEHLKQDGHSDMNVKVFADINKYTERLEQLSSLDIKVLNSTEPIMEMLMAISL